MNPPQSVTANFGIASSFAPVASLASASPLSLSATVGTTSAAQSATLTNYGSAALTISGITITGSNPSDFVTAIESVSKIQTAV
jgi:hypothetical protein